MTSYWDHSPPHPCERLARMEGQSNFLSLLAGIEAGPDTTQDMAALAMCRCRGVLPEALEARWGGSLAYKTAFCKLVFDVLQPAEKDKTWARAAILDGFYRFTGNKAQTRVATERAKTFGCSVANFRLVRKFAQRVLSGLADEAERPWIRARFGD